MRTAPADEADRTRTAEVDPESREWRLLHDRFPVPPEHTALVDDLLALHTPRQLVALHAILERIDAELRAPAVEAALRLAFLEALLPSTRLAAIAGKPTALRIANGRVQPTTAGQWRERNAWLAFEDGLKLVRGFVQRLDSGSTGLVQARFRDDLRGLGEQPNSVMVRVASAAVIEIIAAEAAKHGNQAGPRIRLVAGQLPPQPTPERLALGYFATGWVLGANAAASLPIDAMLGDRAPGPDDDARRIEAQLGAATGLIARESRAVLLLDEGGSTNLAAAAIGAVGAGYRVTAARLDPGPDGTGVLELVPPGGNVPGGPRTRANQALPPLPGGAGDPNYVPGRGLFAPPERLDAHRFSRRGRSGGRHRPRRRCAAGARRARHRGAAHRRAARRPRPRRPPAAVRPRARRARAGRGRRPHARARADGGPAPGDHPRRPRRIRRLGRPTGRRLEQVEPGNWWLADREDRAHAALPLADRVEWAVFSLLSTGGPITRAGLVERITAMFPGPDQPDEALILACLDSYGAPDAPEGRLATHEDLNRRGAEQTELLALLTETGHRLGFRVWLGPKEQARAHRGGRLQDLLDERELEGNLTGLTRASDADLENVACIWYVRHRVTFLFEVEWTAMLGEPILRRHARIASHDRLVRFLAVAPERSELVRAKLERSILLRRAIEAGNWHILKWNHLRDFAALDDPHVDDLEPYLGIDAPIETGRLQIPLFATPG